MGISNGYIVFRITTSINWYGYLDRLNHLGWLIMVRVQKLLLLGGRNSWSRFIAGDPFWQHVKSQSDFVAKLMITRMSIHIYHCVPFHLHDHVVIFHSIHCMYCNYIQRFACMFASRSADLQTSKKITMVWSQIIPNICKPPKSSMVFAWKKHPTY